MASPAWPAQFLPPSKGIVSLSWMGGGHPSSFQVAPHPASLRVSCQPALPLSLCLLLGSLSPRAAVGEEVPGPHSSCQLLRFLSQVSLESSLLPPPFPWMVQGTFLSSRLCLPTVEVFDGTQPGLNLAEKSTHAVPVALGLTKQHPAVFCDSQGHSST